MTTPDLIKSCLKNQPEAEKQLFFRFAGKVLTLCRRYVSQQAEAKDLMQECFIQVFDKLAQYDQKKGEFEGWLYRVCTNVVLQHLRKEKRSVALIYPPTIPEVEDQIDEKGFEEISDEVLLKSIQELPEGYRVILNLYIFEGLKHREIAQRLKISPATSRSQYTRAKQLLKTVLQKKINKNHPYYERRLA